MANISREERQRREQRAQTLGERDFAAERNEAKSSGNGARSAAIEMEERLAETNARDERPENMRPGAIMDIETQKPFPDDREPPATLNDGVSQMSGRMYLGPPVTDEKYNLRVMRGEANFVDERNQLADQSGEEVHILNNYQSPTQGRIVAGTVTRLPRDEAKRLVNMGKAKFMDVDQ